MITLAVDDVLSIAQQIRDLMTEIDPEGRHYAESDPAEVQRLVKEIKPDLIWLDIEMPGYNGLELAAEIQTILPDTNIVFVTGYSKYAVDAFGMHVSGYVMKPVTKERLMDEIANLRIPPKKEHGDEALLRVQCFGNFEVFGPGGIVKFGRSLSKEAFAYLIDRRGAGCTVAEICSILWEDRTADKGLKSQCRVIMGALKKDLERTRVYLELERLAGDRNFDVEYRLNVKDFMIPHFSLQPVVENAVRHGADRNGEKTEIVVTTFETNRGIIIEVANTVPSDPVVYEKKENRKSVGLENVSSRLASYCRGTLDMQTSDGVTRVTIKIPKAVKTGGSKTRS